MSYTLSFAQKNTAYQDYLLRVQIASGMSEKSSPKRCFYVQELNTGNPAKTILLVDDYYCPHIHSCLEECSKDTALESYNSTVELNLSDEIEDYKSMHISYFGEILFYSYVSGEWYLKKEFVSPDYPYDKGYR
ncbi:MAG TPA: hypothetical protein PKC21_03840 [Oligoflexia bacterium]|nr:hypothetical protein [Oligoflexia bacterium]HMR24469.1 hypothetical protein [Oligoflexia bacterium]